VFKGPLNGCVRAFVRARVCVCVLNYSVYLFDVSRELSGIVINLKKTKNTGLTTSFYKTTSVSPYQKGNKPWI